MNCFALLCLNGKCHSRFRGSGRNVDGNKEFYVLFLLSRFEVRIKKVGWIFSHCYILYGQYRGDASFHSPFLQTGNMVTPHLPMPPKDIMELIQDAHVL